MEQQLTSISVPHSRVVRSSRFLLLVVFFVGIATLAIEMVASRLLAPYFGTSQPIWAAVIGLTLVYLAIGYRLGGSLADRYPDERMLYQVIVGAGLLTGFIPLLSAPILGFAQQALAQFMVGGFLGALLGVLVLFSLPVILMAMVSPFAVRLQLKRVEAGVAAAGSVAGALSALSTVGSIGGTFLTALYLIPAIGTARTIYLIAAFLIITGLIGLRDWRYLLPILIVASLYYYTTATQNSIKSADCSGCVLIAEEESAYNYLQVATRDTPRGTTVNLIMNEGQAIQSIRNRWFDQTGDPLDLLTGGGPWDYFAVAPYVFPNRDAASIKSLAMLGSATGTVPAQFLATYGPQSRVDAIEIDPRIIALGRKYFGMRDSAVAADYPNYRVYAQDARYWLTTSQGAYDVIGLDAYRQPYVPFHLTTVEFFQLVRARLTPDGVAVVNAGKGLGGDDRLGQAMATTMRAVFPQVFVIETAGFANQILIGVNRPVGDGVANFQANYMRMQHPALRTVMDWSLRLGLSPIREYHAGTMPYAPFTDDRAPVEQLIDSLILDAAFGKR